MSVDPDSEAALEHRPRTSVMMPEVQSYPSGFERVSRVYARIESAFAARIFVLTDVFNCELSDFLFAVHLLHIYLGNGRRNQQVLLPRTGFCEAWDFSVPTGNPVSCVPIGIVNEESELVRDFFHRHVVGLKYSVQNGAAGAAWAGDIAPAYFSIQNGAVRDLSSWRLLPEDHVAGLQTLGLGVTIVGEQLDLFAEWEGGEAPEVAAKVAAERFIALLDTLASEFESGRLSGTGRPCRVVDLYLLSPTEQALIAFANHDQERSALPPIGTYRSHFSHVVKTQGDHLAVSDSDGNLTYAELDTQAGEVAFALHWQGITPGSYVVTICHRDRWAAILPLACFKLGCCYIPLTADTPAARVSQIADRAGASLVLLGASGPHMDTICAECREDLPVLSCKDLHGHGSVFQAEIDPTVPAYCVFTSGSTGEPKGVVVSHGALNNLVTWHARTYSLDASAIVGQVASFGFDAFVWDMWPALCSGSALVLGTERLMNDPIRLFHWMDEKAITHLFVPPAIASTLYPLALENPDRLALRCLLTGSDQVDQFPPVGLRFKVFNNYGPTECAVIASYCEIEPQPLGRLRAYPSIGLPIRGAAFHILDAQDRQCPIGAAGRLHVEGRCLADGYLNNARSTAERFRYIRIADGASPIRLYDTGDMAQFRFDGNVDFLGRTDFQISLHGFRIELNELETAVRKLNGVHGAVVCKVGTGERATLVACCVLESAGEPPEGGPAAIDGRPHMAVLRKLLPSYMVPHVFVRFAAFPLNANKKVDRREIARQVALINFRRVSTPPRYAIEQRVAEAVCGVLGLESVGREEDFFELGGTSLLAIKLVSCLNQIGWTELDITAVFLDGRVTAIADWIEFSAHLDRQQKNLVNIDITEIHPSCNNVRSSEANIARFYRTLIANNVIPRIEPDKVKLLCANHPVSAVLVAEAESLVGDLIGIYDERSFAGELAVDSHSDFYWRINQVILSGATIDAHALVWIWRTVSDQADLCDNTNLFAAKIDSQYLRSFHAVVGRVANINLRPDFHYLNQTPREQADYLNLVLCGTPAVQDYAIDRQSGEICTQNNRPTLQDTPCSQSIPVTAAQRRILELAGNKKSDARYNISAAILKRGAFEITELERRITEIQRRFPLLGCRIERTVAGWVNTNCSQPVGITVRAAADKAEARDFVRKELGHEFSLIEAPLFRFNLVRRSPHYDVLLLVMHHIVSDGDTLTTLINLLLSDTSELQRGACNPDQIPILFFDYAKRELEYFESIAYQSDLIWWREYLDECCPQATLPPNRMRPSARTFEADSIGVLLKDSDKKSLDGRARKKKTTVFILVAAALQWVLAREFCVEDINIGIPVNNRSDKDKVQADIGYYLNTVILRLRSLAEQQFDTMIESLRTDMARIMGHRRMPLVSLQADLSLTQSGSYAPAFQILFSYFDTRAVKKTPISKSISLRRLNSYRAIAKFDLCFNVIESIDQLSIYIDYNTALYEHDYIKRFLNLICYTLKETGGYVVSVG